MEKIVSSRERLMQMLRENVRNFLLIRHGQKEKRPEKDAPDAPLTEVGRSQASHLGEKLRGMPIKAIFCSDLARAKETAACIRIHFPDIPYEEREELREIRETTLHAALEDLPPEEIARRRRAVEGVAAVAAELKERFSEGDVVAVFAHGNFHRTLIACFGGVDPWGTIPVKMHNASVTLLHVPNEGSPWIMLGNDVSHLPADLINAHP